VKRIIYNKKVEKIFVAFLLFVLIANIIFPNVVIAAVTWAGNNATGSIQEVVDSMRTLSTNAQTGSNQKTIADMLMLKSEENREAKVNQLKTTVINELKKIFPDLNEELFEKAYNYYRNDQNLIEVTCCIGGSSYNGYFLSGFTIVIGEELTQAKIEEDLEGKTDEDIGEVDTDTQIDTAPDSSAAGQDPEGGPTVEVDEDKTHADLGGILLSPVFYLINFVADAVISITGTVMDPNNSLDFGLGVLTNTKPNPGYTKTINYDVDTTSFIPTNLIGVAVEGGSILYQYPHLTYTPEEIFAGKIDLLSIDFISGKDYEGNQNENEGWLNIRKVVSQWYQILRMIAIIGLLSVLIYTGIKIIISANAKDKAKYKEWIINWFMAVAILFSMHLIMAFIVTATGEFAGLMTETCQGIHVIPSDNEGNEFDTNLMGLVRFMIQSENFYIKIGYEVMYIALIWYTLKFTFVYLKRVLNMAFLTLIAPIVALTYPIDKINDGRAQGFEMWLKEYIFNALLQPMHCILYYILVGSAVGIAASNPLYGIVVLAFMAEAEKLLKKIFGFDKAGGGTVGGMANAFAAGAIASSISKMVKLPKGNGGKGGNGGSGNADPSNNYLDNFKPEKLGKDGNIAEDFSNTLIDDRLDSGDTSADDASKGKKAVDDTSTVKTDSGDTSVDDTSTVKTDSGDTSVDDTSTVNAGEGKKGIDDTGTDDTSSGDSGAGAPGAGDTSELTARQLAQRKREQRRAGLKNVKKTLMKPLFDSDRKDTGYNKQMWKRRGVKALKGIGKAYLGASLGIAAAAVQAGISITDGKYNPMEGMASFAAGYAGGGSIASGMGSAWSTVSNAYKEGYYGDKKGQETLKKKLQDQFMADDDVYKAYKKKYGDEGSQVVVDRMKAASEHMIPYGINDTKQQFKIQKMAGELLKGKDTSNEEIVKRAYKQARDTNGFIDQLESQGVGKKIINEPAAQEDYIDSYIKAKGLEKNDTEAIQIRKSLNNAFRSAAVWQRING